MKSKQTLKYKYTRKEALRIARDSGYGYSTFEKYLLSKQSTPKKKSKEIKEIKPLTLFFNENEDFYEINEMRHTDSRIDLLAEKLNQVIDTINLLIKNK